MSYQLPTDDGADDGGAGQAEVTATPTVAQERQQVERSVA